MKEDKLDKFIKETLKDDIDLVEYMGDISIPDFEETMNEFKNNIEISKKIKKDISIRGVNKMKISYKKVSVIAAALVLAIGIPTFNHFNNMEDNMNINVNIGGISSGQSGNVQIPNPLVEVKSEEEAEKECGFHIEKVNYIPKGYEKEAIVYIGITEKDKLVRQIFMDKNEGKIDFQKYSEKHDIKSDWNEYDNKEEITILNNKVTLYYSNGKLYKALWNNNGFVYEISSLKDIEKEEMIKMIENLE